MNISIVTVSKIKEKYILEGINEYIKRLRPYCSIKIKEVDAQKVKSSVTLEKIKELEAEKLLQQTSTNSFKVALDERGKEYSSTELANYLENCLLSSGKSELCFIVGGANGLSKGLIKESDSSIALSRLTFPHQLVRLILLEQLYRAFKIIKNEPYHK